VSTVQGTALYIGKYYGAIYGELLKLCTVVRRVV